MAKRLLILVCMIVIVSMIFTFFGCSDSGKGLGITTKSADTSSVTTTMEENPFEEFYEITWLTQLNADYQEGRWDETELEELFNVDLQVWAEDGRNLERMAAFSCSRKYSRLLFYARCSHATYRDV